MDDPLPELTDAQRSRIWAALNKLDHRFRTKQIGLNECKREAYIVCARELSDDSARAIAVHYGRELKWWPTYYLQTGRAGGFRRFGVAPPPVPVPQPIPEAVQRAELAKLAADLIQKRLPRPAAKQARYPVRASWLQDRLVERKWNKHRLAHFGGPDPKTTQKVLDSFAVRDDVLRKIADGLSVRGAKVSLIDIPQK